MKYFKEFEQKALLKTVSQTKGKKAERDHFLMFFLFKTGLRLTELVSLNLGDVRNREKLWVREETAKRSKPREIPLSAEVQKRIKQFIKNKLVWGESIADNAPLFVSKRGNRLSKRMVQVLVGDWCIKADLYIEKDGKKKGMYSTHSLRHSFAMRLRERDRRIESVQKLLGHSSLASTGVYTEPDWQELEDAVNEI